MMPPTAPAPGDPMGDVPGCVPPPARPVLGCAAADDPPIPLPNCDEGCDEGVDVPPRLDAPPRPAPCCALAAEPGTAWPARIGWKSSLVMGSLNFLRINRCS